MRLRWPGRSTRPDPDFDAAGYAASYPDIAETLGQDPAKLFRHWTEWGCLENRTPFGLAPYRDRRRGGGFTRRSPTITMYGLFDSPSGLGAAGRAYLAALKAAGYDVTPVTVEDHGLRFETRPDIRERPAGLLRRSKVPPVARRSRVNVFALNADMVHRFLLDGRRGVLDDGHNIAIWFWELASFPSGWAATFGPFDEIWVASAFCRDAIGAVSPVPVALVPMPVLPAPEADLLPRSYFGLPEDVFLFGCTFDVGSLVRRKNPLAAIEAFLDRFRDRRDAMLVLKYHGTAHYPASVEPFLAAAAGHDGIRLIDRTFDAREAASFRAALDCVVSPHRSEGFGLNLAEAMLCGKPVIATGYSGSTEFMGPDDSLPVRFDLAAVGPGAWPYPAAALWAEPDRHDLADRMEEAFADRERVARIAARGAARIATEHSPEAAVPHVRARLDPVFAGPNGFRRWAPARSHVSAVPPPPPSSWGRGRAARTIFVGSDGPLLAVLASTDRFGGAEIEALAAALPAQSHASWELVCLDVPGSAPAPAATLDALRGLDARYRIALGRGTRRIGDVLAMTEALILVLPDPGAPLPPEALAACAAAVASSSPERAVRLGSLTLLPRHLALRASSEPYAAAALARIAAAAIGPEDQPGARP